MGIDYYSVLEISRSASPVDIRKAYARVSVREHPDRTHDCNGDSLSVEDLDRRSVWFELAGEAYEVLRSPLLRAAFDQFGEEGLKHGVPARDPELFLKPWSYHGDGFKTYREFFGTQSASMPLVLAWQLEHEKMQLRRPDGENGPWFRAGPLEVPVQVPLQTVAMGGVVETRIQRRELQDGLIELREHVLRQEVPPGVLPGSRFRFPRQGHQALNSVPGDVELVTEDAPHRELQRYGDNDLVARFHVSLEEALLGCAVHVRTLDGRTLRIRVTDIIKPNYELRVRGEGLPRTPRVVDEPDPNRICHVKALSGPGPTEACESCAYAAPDCIEEDCEKLDTEDPDAVPEESDMSDGGPDVDRGDLVLQFQVEWPQAVPVARREVLRRALRDLTPGIPQGRVFVTPIQLT